MIADKPQNPGLAAVAAALCCFAAAIRLAAPVHRSGLGGVGVTQPIPLLLQQAGNKLLDEAADDGLQHAANAIDS